MHHFKFLFAVGVLIGAQSCQEKIETAKAESDVTVDVVEEMVASEEVILSLTYALQKLGKGIVQKQLPDQIEIVGVLSSGDEYAYEGIPVVRRHWQVGGKSWEALFGRMQTISEAKLGVLHGKFGETRNDFEIKAKFTAKAIDAQGKTVGIKGKVFLHWKKEEDLWRLISWQTKELTTLETAKPFFRDLAKHATQGDERARISLHDYWIELFLSGQNVPFYYGKEKQRYFAIFDSLEQHPGVSVVDIDGDGWDDFYVMARWGKNQLWRNRGDGTFEEIAGRVGLDVNGMCNAAVFADFDNDGDVDLFLGRSLERCRYYRNDDGVFSDRSSELVRGNLPYLCSSVSAADYNGDGLLDVYLSTYYLPKSAVGPAFWTKDFLTKEQTEEWKKRRRGDHPVFRLTGPPNVLLVNRGGYFEFAEEGKETALWLCSFQSTWSDYDSDGDPDLFVANDYGPDVILRNDFKDGKRSFTDVTRELAGGEMQGFGMGVTLGDYDNDGIRDLFLTYMFSKAGSRITKQLPVLEKRMMDGARGNKLFRGTGKGFELVSGLEPPALQVAVTGWSWGGQLGDLDNDGFLDLYVPNGYYTAPKAVASQKDL